MEDRKTNISWTLIAMVAATAIAIAALVLNWQARADLKREIAALSTLQLRSAVLSSAPYREELSLLERLTSGDKALSAPMAILAKFQDSGIPSLTSLKEQLEAAATSALVAEQSRPELGIFDSLASKIAATAVVVGLETGSNPLNSELAPVVREAEKTLHDGLLEQTIATLSGLPGDLSVKFDGWKRSAESRVEAIKAIDELNAKLLTGPQQIDRPPTSGPG